jgi:hypothetical protein
MSSDDVFEIAKNCVKCHDPKPDQTRKHERTHVVDEGNEDNAESLDEVPEDEFETTHWVNDNDHGIIDRGTGNDFGLTTTHVTSSGVGMTRTTPVSATVPYM